MSAVSSSTDNEDGLVVSMNIKATWLKASWLSGFKKEGAVQPRNMYAGTIHTVCAQELKEQQLQYLFKT